MIRKLALFVFLALSAASLGGVAFFTPPPLIVARGCTDTSPHVVTATGAGNITASSGCGHVWVEAWGPGASGRSQTVSGSAGDPAGGAGAYAGSSGISVVGGTTVIYWNNYAGGAGVTNSTGNNGAGKTWINVGTNSAPSSSTTGAMADFGVYPTYGGLTANSIGATLHAGGSGYAALNVYGGGGSSGCPTADGITATSATGAASAGTDSGPGGRGNATAPESGTQPGGGGGGSNTSTPSGKGGDGQVRYTFSAFLELAPSNNNVERPEAA
jgi:hypothetical protein